MNRIARFGVFAVLGLLVLALLTSPTAGRQLQAQDLQPGTGARADRARLQADPAVYPEEEPDATSAYLMIPGSALRPGDTSDVETEVHNPRLGCVYAESGIAGEFLITPIYPPQGATLTNLRVFVYDASVQASVAEI